MKVVRKYSMFIIAMLAILFIYLWDHSIGLKAIATLKSSSKEMILILPPVFVLLGLLDIWVPRDTMVKFMGENTGFLGAVLAFLLGSAAAGPLYVVFPIAAAFMKKDVKFSNVLILIGAWSATKIPMFMFELSSLGPKFALTRIALNIPIVVFIAFAMNKVLPRNEVEKIYEAAKSL